MQAVVEVGVVHVDDRRDALLDQRLLFLQQFIRRLTFYAKKRIAMDPQGVTQNGSVVGILGEVLS